MTHLRRRWDVLVIGAGPAGAVAAREMARLGLSVLLVEKAAFPRPKVCGCCVNAAALESLTAMELSPAALGLRVAVTRRIRLHARGRCAAVQLPAGAAVLRSELDSALAGAATASGATFLPATHARVEKASGTDTRTVLLSAVTGPHTTVAARIVLVASGLGARIGDESVPASVVSRGGRMGVSCIMEAGPSDCPPGTIEMACGRRGYVGMVRLSDGRVNVAACLDPSFVRQSGGPGAAASGICAEAGLGTSGPLAAASWRGTGLLTRRRPTPGAERLLVLGDAAAYVEPFTGDGMAWAVGCGRAVAPLAARAVEAWDDETIPRWTRMHRRLVGKRLVVCRLVRHALRRPHLVAAAAALLAALPAAAAPLVRTIHAPLKRES